jgi:hypothetical protein
LPIHFFIPLSRSIAHANSTGRTFVLLDHLEWISSMALVELIVVWESSLSLLTCSEPDGFATICLV